ncbi:leucine-rich repeat protein [Treponema denticola]|uniref:leucine-rich repeat protein n=1 Tax=Treponema denticola TaxID=158 RepID=UPI003D04F146
MKRLLKILTAAVAVILLFTACQQFLEDPEDFLSYWASETFVKNHSIDSANRPDGAGVPCVGSSAEVPITLSVHNPKGFSFVMPTSSAPAGIVEFKELSSQPTAETDYALERTGSGALKLTYKPSLLQKYEQGSGSLNPTITLKAKDGRVFKQTYTFGIKSNTPPPKPNEIVIAKTNTSPSKYVLCLKFKLNEMTKTVPIGSPSVPVHKDIRSITINDTPYTLLYNSGDSDFQTPGEGSFIESGEVEKLDTSSPDVPQGKWVLYFNTGVKVESYIPQTSYIITLSDEGGVVSDSVTAELKEKFEVKFDAKSGNYTPNTQYILKGDKVTKPSQDPERMGHIFGGWYTDTSYSTQWDFVTNTVTSNMTLYAKWTEAKYTVKFRVADGEGKLEGSYGTHNEIAQNDSGEVSFTNVPHGTQVAFTATPNDGWELDDWTGVSSSLLTANLTVNGDKTVTVKFKPGVLSLSGGPDAWQKLKTEAAKTEGAHTIIIEGPITATNDGDNKGEIKLGRNLTIKGKNSYAILNADKLSRIFNVPDGKTLILENLTLTGGKAAGSGEGAQGGGILVKEGCKAKLKNCTVKKCQAEENGGAIYSEGELTLEDSIIGGASASDGNKAKNGGGIFLTGSDAACTMTGGKISYNEARRTDSERPDGGGIYIEQSASFTMKSGEISNNKSENSNSIVAYGGGVYVNGQTGGTDPSASFTLENGTIKNNTAYFGGGVVLNNGGIFNMQGGTIEENHATNDGGGVGVQGIMKMAGGTISGNTASGKGKGVYVSSNQQRVMEMSGSAKIDTDNDVYLDGMSSSNAKITVNGTLSNNPVARITVPDNKYQSTTKVLDGSTVGTHYTKFTVTPDVKEEGIAQTWTIDSTGNLEKSNMEVRYDRLQYYLTTSTHAVVEDGIYRFKITGTIPPEDLRSKYFERMGKLARTIQNSHKNVALILPDRIPGLGGMYQCFYECEYLVSLENIPLGVTGIQECFKGCKNLTKAPVIPDSVDNMEECFQSCEALKEAPAIPSGVTAIKSCFNGCKELTKAPALPLGVTDIYACFAGCEKLTKAPAIPSGVREIEHCFDGCKALTQGPDIPSTVTNIQKCFKGCTNLKKVTLNCVYGNVHAFSDIFKDCTSLDYGGIKVPSGQLQTYQDNAGNMGTTADKFSAL